MTGRDNDRVDVGHAVEEAVGAVDGGEGRDGAVWGWRRTTSTGGPPSTKRRSSWPWPTTSITARPTRPAGQYCGISDQA
jgi:hypothetical protein